MRIGKLAKSAPVALGGGLALASAAASVGMKRRRLARSVEHEARALFERSRGPATMSLDGLPPPVRRYLELAVRDTERPVSAVRLRHGGTFRTSLDGAWMSIRGQQYFTADEPAFLWWGRVRMAPGVWVDGRDSSIAGEGRMRVELLSTFRLADARGPDLDQGALVRLLGEMFWMPPALADRRYVTWTEAGEHAASAVLRVGGRQAEATFEFDDRGLPSSFRAMRMRDVRGKGVLTPFDGRGSDFRWVSGLYVPHHVEGAWVVDGARKEYARFDVETFEVNRPEPFD